MTLTSGNERYSDARNIIPRFGFLLRKICRETNAGAALCHEAAEKRSLLRAGADVARDLAADAIAFIERELLDMAARRRLGFMCRDFAAGRSADQGNHKIAAPVTNPKNRTILPMMLLPLVLANVPTMPSLAKESVRCRTLRRKARRLLRLRTPARLVHRGNSGPPLCTA